MIKCLECGFKTNRLQWTHFKYKCTGRFKNSKEYKNAYPNAKLVSPELANKTAVTLENLCLKYGSEMGNQKWEDYRIKQAESNSFEYKSKRHGWSKKQFDEYNRSRAQTLHNMISRYGEEEGTSKWITYCERQAYTNSLIYYKEKYGIDKGEILFNNLNKKKASANNPRLLAEKLNISVDEAIKIILSRRNSSNSIWGSKIEQTFTEMLQEKMNTVLEYTTFTKPFGLWSSLLNSYVIYDIKHLDCIIEFNGDYWHANPKVYSEDALIRGTTAMSIREKDSLKLKTAELAGFRTFTVWESDFKNDKDTVIEETIKWIQNGQK